MPKEHESLTKVMEEKTFVIADYQRPYAWTTKQLADLWGDLDLLGTGEHYAGTLVLRETGNQKVTSAGESLRVYEVVDGQQRLTTVTILLSRLLARLGNLGTVPDPGLADGVEEATRQVRRLIRVTLTGGAPEERLRLGTDLAGFWRDHIIGDLPAPSDRLAAEQRLLDASAFFDSRLDELIDPTDAQRSANRLLDLRRRITSGLKLLVYEVNSTAEVGVIFETLNDRGRPLTTLEKTKNYLLYLGSQIQDPRGEKLAELINNRWSSIFKNLAALSGESEDRLLRAHWLATQNPDRRTWTGVDAVKAKFPRTKYVSSSARLDTDMSSAPTDTNEVWQSLSDDVTAYVNGLWQCSEFLADLENPNAKYGGWEPNDILVVQRYSHALGRSGVVAPFLPLLFACRLKLPKDGASYGRILQACETFSARVFAIAVRRSGAGQTALAGAANRLYRGVSSPDDTITEISKLTWEYAPDSMIKSNLQTTTNWYVRSSHKFVLYEYELSKGKAAGIPKPFAEFNKSFQKTTEHILPQTPDTDSQWLKDFKDPEERNDLTHCLGNLVLTMDNSSYGNKEFAGKRGAPNQTTPACYFGAALLSEREIANWDTWTPVTVIERLENLEKWILARWPATGPAVAAVAVDDTEDDSEN